MTPRAATSTTIFNPSPQEADGLLALYHDPSVSLADLAREAGTTLPHLQRWLASPQIASQLDTLEQANAQRIRALAAQHLPAAIGVLTSILREHLHAHRTGTLSDDPQIRQRQHETARKAATLLANLSRWTPGPTATRSTSASTTTTTSSANATTATTPKPNSPRQHHHAPDPAFLARLLGLTAASPTNRIAAYADDAQADPITTDAGAPDPTPADAHAEDSTPAHTEPAAASANANGAAPDTPLSANPPTNLSPETLTALERLSTIPDDADPQEVNALVATVLRDPFLPTLIALAPVIKSTPHRDSG